MMKIFAFLKQKFLKGLKYDKDYTNKLHELRD